MIHHPILLAIGTGRETRMADAIRLIAGVLIEDAALGVLAPVLDVHGVVAHELELAQAVVAIVRPGCRVNDEILAGVRVRELFGAFVGGEAVVEGAAVGGLFPGFRGHAEDLALGEVGAYGPGVFHWVWHISLTGRVRWVGRGRGVFTFGYA